MQGGEMIVAQLKAVLRGRVYPDVVPEDQQDWPVAVYQVISSAPANTQDFGYAGIQQSRYQVDFYGLSRKEASELVQEALPLLIDPVIQTSLVCLYEGKRDIYESETRRFRTAVDLTIWES